MSTGGGCQIRDKPTLVLNGDIMELSLTSTHKAAMSFQRLIELLMPAGEENLFNDEILFIPGNHDHNLWETSRFNAYLDLIKEDDPKKIKIFYPSFMQPGCLPRRQ
jgi:metallophosphoesterase superfamily enzyme